MKSLFLILLCFFTVTAFGQGTESFTNTTSPTGSYGSGSYTGDGGVIWTYNGARKITATYTITGTTQGFGSSGTRNISAPSGVGGVGTVTYKTRSYFTGGTAADRTIQLYVNGIQYDNFTLPAEGPIYNRSIPVNVAGNVTIEFRSTGTRQIAIDDAAWTAATTCTAPTTQASTGFSSSVTTSSGTISWTNGNGNGRIVVLQAGSAAGTPSSGTIYTDNGVFGSGDAIGTGFVVYDGTGTSVNATSLSSGTTYHYAIYEYATTGTCYLTPGLIGSFTTTAISNTSDIIPVAASESATFPASETTAGPLTSAQGIQVWEFEVRDGGAVNDADNLATTLESFTLTRNAGNGMNDWDVAFQSVDIFDGTTHLATGTITATNILFSGLTIVAPDNGNKVISIRASLNCPASNSNNLDGDDFVFNISQGNVSENAAGSQFASFALCNSANGSNVYDQQAIVITSHTPTSGPTGTLVSINATGGGFTGATAVSFNGTASSSYTVISDNLIEAVVPAGMTSGNITVTDVNCYDANSTAFTFVDEDATSCATGGLVVIPLELYFSEVTDASAGSFSYIEIYNGTGASVNLATYSINQRTNGTGPGTDFALAGTLLNGNTYVVRVGATPGACTAASLPSGYPAADQIETTISGVNNNDCFSLKNGGVVIDVWGLCDGTNWVVGGAAGYNYIRKPNMGPNTTYTSAEWNITDWTTCSNNEYSTIGSHSAAPVGTPPSITSQPTTTQLCNASSTNLTVGASAMGGFSSPGLAYQWFVVAPGTATWTTLTNSGVYTGATTATLNISDVTGLDGYQYYCQARENTATCFTASEAIELEVFGAGGTAGLWKGDTDTDWCDCFNWDDGKVPVATTNITIDETASNDCIATTGCAGLGSTLMISSSNGTNNTLTISGTGSVNITNALAINKSAGAGNLIMEIQGIGNLSAGNLTITGSGGSNNAILRNESASSTVDINGNLTIFTDGLLDLNSNGTLNLAGNFINNNSVIAFDEATSTVIFDGVADQSINTNGFTEIFHNITLAKTGGVLTLQDNVDIDASGIIALSDDQIDINSLQLRVLNPAIGAFTRTSGSIIEESGAATGNNVGKLIWDIGSTGGIHSFPFATGTGGTYIPFVFELTSGTAGEVSLSTYGTVTTNLPWPSAPEVVTNLNSTGGLTPDNRNATADRFWQIDVENAATANITFSYQNSELPIAPFADHTNMIAQRYNSTLNKWELQVYPGQVRNVIAGGYNVFVPNISTFSPWTLAHLDSPLPAELIKFDVTKSKDVAILDWSTASEINTDEFVLEKSKDGQNFIPFASEPAAGNSNSVIEYNQTDYSPYSGYNYYRLKTVDFDVTFEISDVKTVYFGNELTSVIYNNDDWILPSTSIEKGQVSLINSLGQLVDIRSIASISESRMNINHSDLATGVYIIQVKNGSESYNLKVIK